MKEPNETTLYEIGYVLMPLLTPENALEEAAQVKNGVEKLGAEMTEEGSPKMIPLGFPMPRRISDKKFNFQDGYFGWMRFRLNPSKISEVKDILVRREVHGSMLRHLLISVDEKALIADAKAAEAKLAHREATEAKSAAEAEEGVTEAAPEEVAL
ncbi:MAG: hypothetical protein V4674_04095 [Patescibacteria group bacterium]